jgi:hypothetical protein
LKYLIAARAAARLSLPTNESGPVSGEIIASCTTPRCCSVPAVLVAALTTTATVAPTAKTPSTRHHL